MSTHPDTTHPPDICLILRAHAEQHWLLSEVIPTVRQLEATDFAVEDQAGAALAYLEVLWIDAGRRARETDDARRALDQADGDCDHVLCQRAHRYHTAVRRMRLSVAARVAELTGLHAQTATHEHASS